MASNTLAEVHTRVIRLEEAMNARVVHRATIKDINKLQATIAKLFKQQRTDVLAKLDKLTHYFSESLIDDFNTLFGVASAATSDDMQAAIEKAIAPLFIGSGRALIKQFDPKIVFSLDNPRAIAYLKDHAAISIKQIDDTTRDTLKTILVNGVDNGTSYQKIAKQIRDKYTDMSVTRSTLIAVDQIGNAYQAGNLAAGKHLQSHGIELQKAWGTSNDSKVTPECKANQDEGWIDLDDTFASGHDRPLRFPRCRCYLRQRRKQ